MNPEITWNPSRHRRHRQCARKPSLLHPGSLGMRLVKKTVNQDDVSAYHLFYADAQGSPGSDLTFFDWAHSPDNATGTTASVAPVCASAEWNLCNGGSARFDQLQSSALADPGAGRTCGHRFRGRRRSAAESRRRRKRRRIFRLVRQSGTAIPPDPGLGPVTITVPKLESTGALLTEVLGMRPTLKYADPDKKIQRPRLRNRRRRCMGGIACPGAPGSGTLSSRSRRCSPYRLPGRR